MWKRSCRIALFVTSCSLAGCGASSDDRYSVGGSNYIYGWEDPMTGCRYLYTYVSGGVVMLPRLGSDGRPFCVSPRSKPGDQ